MNARNLDFIGRYNRRKYFPLVDDKMKTKVLAQKYRMPVPQLFFTVERQHDIDDAVDRLQALPGFAVKPANGSGGKGIWVITERREADFVKPSGAVVSSDDLRRHMSNALAGLYSLGGKPDGILVEDLINRHPMFDGLSHEGVPDLRVIVFQGYPVMAMLRLATHASDGKANLHQGAVGVGLAIDSGRCTSAVQFNKHVEKHPDTGRLLSELVIPEWRAILELASSCYEMTRLGYLGTDIVIDRDRGAMLLELNARPGLSIQVANNCGLLPRLRHIEKLEDGPPKSPAERVAYSMQTFIG